MADPRIGVVGTGAIGGFYGLMLARAGFDVSFLLRSEYLAVKERGLLVKSQVHGDLSLDPVQAYPAPEQMPRCDWLLVGVKTTANAELAPLLNQIAAPGARVLLLQNGFAVEEALRPLLRDDLHLLGGLCNICVHREAPGVIVHQALGGLNIGYHSGPGQTGSPTEEAMAMFSRAGLAAQALSSVEQARWLKLVWNLPFNGLSVARGASTRQLLADAEARNEIVQLMDEVITAAQASGYDLSAGLVERLLQGTMRLPDYWPSMYHDYANGRPLELEAIYRQPIAAAAWVGVAMPRTQALLARLEALTQ